MAFFSQTKFLLNLYEKTCVLLMSMEEKNVFKVSHFMCLKCQKPLVFTKYEKVPQHTLNIRVELLQKRTEALLQFQGFGCTWKPSSGAGFKVKPKACYCNNSSVLSFFPNSKKKILWVCCLFILVETCFSRIICWYSMYCINALWIC